MALQRIEHGWHKAQELLPLCPSCKKEALQWAGDVEFSADGEVKLLCLCPTCQQLFWEIKQVLQITTFLACQDFMKPFEEMGSGGA